MRLKTFVLPSCFALLLLALPSYAGRWVHGQDPDQIHYFEGNRKVGTWRYDEQKWYPYDSYKHAWLPSTTPPFEVTAPSQNFGVDRTPVEGERWTIDGREVSKEQGIKAFSGDAIPDDSKLPFLVFVGDPVTGDKIEKDLQGSKDLSGKYRFQSYKPDEFGACDRDGKPCYSLGLTCVSPERKALWHLKEYTSIEDLTNYVRKLPPDYDPAKVPELQDLTEAPLSTSAIPLGAVSLLSLLSGIFLLKRTKS